jgi:hypothetical protein
VTSGAAADAIRALGVHCTPSAIYLALVEGGQVLETGPQKIGVPDGLRSASSLSTLAKELHRRLVETRATHGALLMPHSYESGAKATVSRVGAETLIRVTAGDVGVEMELLNRSTARSRLGIGQGGALDDRLRELLPQPVGNYWTEGRRYAAFAAMACEQAAS